MTRRVSLLVNDQPINLDYFAEAFIDHTIGGMLESLEGTGKIECVDISVKGDDTTINLNNTILRTKPFVDKIIKNTITGMVSSLKGVNEINSVTINITR